MIGLDDGYELPDEIIYDWSLNLSLNVPASRQRYPGWWKKEPELYQKLRAAREAKGIVVDDFPKGTDRMVMPDNTKYVRAGSEEDLRGWSLDA